MIKAFLVFFLILICQPAYSQCVGEVKQIFQDPDRGTIIVETSYTVNGVLVQEKGRVRYDEDTGTAQEIILKAKADIQEHCENLIKRIQANDSFIRSEVIKRQKELTQPLINNIQTAVGFKQTSTEATTIYKGKEIKVTHDSQNTVIDTP